MSAIDDVLYAMDPMTGSFTLTGKTLREAVKELATLRANQLDPKIVEAVNVYQEAFQRWSADCMNPETIFILEKVKEELVRRIEADAKERG